MKDESTKDVQMNTCSDVTNVTPLEKLNASRTQEQRIEAARKAGLASGQARRDRKAKAETLKEATAEYLREHAGEIVSSLGQIAEDKKAPSLQIKAADLLHRMSGESEKQADISINIDLGSMSDAELQTIIDADTD